VKQTAKKPLAEFRGFAHPVLGGGTKWYVTSQYIHGLTFYKSAKITEKCLNERRSFEFCI
jgi:hypothetical protein